MNIQHPHTGLTMSRGAQTDWVESCVDIKNRNNRAFLGVTISKKTRAISFVFIVSVLGLFFVRSVELQVIEGSGFSGLSQRNQIREYRIEAKRGTFTDRNGKRLVGNAPNFTVRLNPSEISRLISERNELALTLSRILELPLIEIQDAMASSVANGSIVVLKDSIARNQALIIATRLNNIDGVELVPEEIRMYAFGGVQSLSHAIGYTGRITKEEYALKKDVYQLNDMLGKDGLEAVYENDLRGIFGEKKVEIDALGFEQSIIAERPAVDGKNIVLTLDYNLQKKSEQALKDVLKKFGTRKGAVIVSSPQTGEILALVSMPSYDNNMFARGISRDEYQKLISDPDVPLFPRATRGEYPPGSTIKMIIAAAALDYGIISPATSIISSGGIRVGKWFFPDWKQGGHGRTDITKALAESVNTYFYMISGGYQSFTGLGIDLIARYLKDMGLGSITGIDLPSEEDGFVPSPEWKKNVKGEVWYIGDTYHTSIGQGDIVVTPMQVNAYTSYFANGGTSYVPHLVKEVSAANAVKGTSVSPRILRSGIFLPETVQHVRKGLRQGALSGSSKRLSLLPFSSAGKTGTAQWKKNSPAHAWFTGWAPYENPQIVITVLVEQGEEGSKSAISVAYDILQWYFLDKTPLTK